MNANDFVEYMKREIEKCFGVSERVLSKCTATEKSLEITLKKPVDKIEFTIEV